METLEDLYQAAVLDIADAEQQFLNAMPKMAAAAQSDELKQAFQLHQEQSQNQAQRLQQIAEANGFQLGGGPPCVAAQGLIQEAEQKLQQIQPGPVGDAAIIACAQKNEHLEIAAYGTLATWAKELGRDQDLSLLKETLNEEEQTDKILSQIAEQGVNRQAVAA